MISIIVPVYKAEKYLHRCVDSIIAQTFTDWELLLVDDGSPDGSGEICDEYAKRDNRIRVFHKENGGVSSARNVGLDNSKGDWIVFADSDDWCEANYLKDFFINDEDLHYDAMVLQGLKNEAKGKIVSVIELKDSKYNNIVTGMLENKLLTFGSPCCKLYSNRLIRNFKIRFPEKYSYGEDTTFFFKTLSVSKCIITSSKCNYHYVDATVGSLSKKDHDFTPISLFLKESMDLVKQIDSSFAANGKLVKAYTLSYKNLLLRSIANMYRLGYNVAMKKKYFQEIKEELLPKIKLDCISLLVLRYFPKFVLIVIFNMIIIVRK